MRDPNHPFQVLLVEDSPGDVQLTRIALQEGKLNVELSVVEDGVEAIAFLKKQGKYAQAPQPELILLDLHLPRKNGLEVLAEIKADPVLVRLPVVMLTTSRAEEDTVRAYNQHVNCYITKPVDFDQFVCIVRSIQDFWFTIVTLPPLAS